MRLLALSLAALAAAPSVSVHAIFSGGQRDGIRAGQALHVDVRNSGGQGIRSICWEPAPIAPAGVRHGQDRRARAGRAGSASSSR